jgi:hypothetical protein
MILYPGGVEGLGCVIYQWGRLSCDEFGLKVLHRVTGRMEAIATGPLTMCVIISAMQPCYNVQFYSVRQKIFAWQQSLVYKGNHKVSGFGPGSAISQGNFYDF